MQPSTNKQCSQFEETAIYLAILTGLAGLIYYFKKKLAPGKIRKPFPKLDIEIRYDADKDADATMLAQTQVRIIRMVLTPLEKRIEREGAKLIYVYGGDHWEMRLVNASPQLKGSIQQLLEAKEW